MKSISKLIFITVFLFAFKCYSQFKKSHDTNYLTSKEYREIKINGIDWNDIKATQGDISKIQHLFRKNFLTEKETEPSLYITFWDTAIYFRFEDRTDEGDHYDLVDIMIDKNIWNLTIKGSVLTVGDPISKLGKIKTLKKDDGTKYAFFMCEECNEDISIYFDSNDRIKEISYTVYN